jgi:predicted permease
MSWNRPKQHFGNFGQRSEHSRTPSWISRWLSDLVQDVVFAFRIFINQRDFTVAVVLSAALGIGACSAIFEIGDFALFQRLRVERPDSLLSISLTSPKDEAGGQTLSFPEVQDLRRSQSFSGVAAYFPMLVASVSSNREPQRRWGSIVTANYFDVVRPRFALGHGFDPDKDDVPGESPVLVLSNTLWRRQFNSDKSIIGQTISINEHRATVVGVTAPGFQGTDKGLVSEFWIPFSMLNDFDAVQSTWLVDRKGRWLNAVGRLRGDTSIRDATAELQVIANRLSSQYPDSDKDYGFHVETAGQINPGIRTMVAVLFTILLAVTILVLLTACTNIANLLLARSSARQNEIAMRLAIGGGRTRLIRQLLTESVLLGLIGGVGGFFIAYGGNHAIGKLRLPIPFPLDFTISLDYRIFFFCATLSITTGILFGLAPALQSTKLDLVSALKGEARNEVSRFRLRTRDALVVAQVSICTILLICSGLFLRSLYSSTVIKLGMNVSNILLFSFDPALNNYGDVQSRELMNSLLDRVRGIPGVEFASMTDNLPLSFGGHNNRFAPEGEPENPGDSRMVADIYNVTPHFFDTLGIPFQEGHDFSAELGPESDSVVINQALAQGAFPKQDAIGHYINYENHRLRIIGVVSTAKSRMIGEGPRPCIYLPVLERFTKAGDLFGITLMVKTKQESLLSASAVRDAIGSTDPDLAIFNTQTMQEHVNNALVLPRAAAVIFTICGLMGLLISTVGLYGVVSFSTARRTKEFGIRMSVGAQRRQIFGMVLRHGVSLTVVGCAMGISMALVVTRFASSLLYGISPHDPITFVLVPGFLLLVAATACLVPAGRVFRQDPVSMLRYE